MNHVHVTGGLNPLASQAVEDGNTQQACRRGRGRRGGRNYPPRRPGAARAVRPTSPTREGGSPSPKAPYVDRGGGDIRRPLARPTLGIKPPPPTVEVGRGDADGSFRPVGWGKRKQRIAFTWRPRPWRQCTLPSYIRGEGRIEGDR